MDPALIGLRLASGAIGPLLRKLLVSDLPGAGLPGHGRRIRLSGLVSFRGEKRTLTERDVRALAATLVERALTDRGEPPFPADETEAVTDTLATTLLALGDLDMDDVQAVRLGHRDLARRLRAAAPAPDGLSTDSVLFLASLTEWACLHILEFFTQRSTFVARTLVEQTRGQAELIAKVDALITRTPRPDGRDTEFERRYLEHLAKKHGRLTIYGIDLHRSPDRWPLDMAYLSLEATAPTGLDPWFPAAGGGVREADGLGTPTPTFSDEELPPDDIVPLHRLPDSLRADLALARHDKVLLRGLAGSGKTTLVQWLTVSAATESRAEGMAYLRDRIPFVLPLRTLTRHGERLPAPDRFLSAAGCPLTPPEGWADRVLAAGRGLVLVDGIDEVPEAERGRARGWLRDLLAAYDGNRWLVTSRPTAVGDDWLTPDGFTELTLSPMSRAEVTTFVHRWHQAAGPEAEPYEQPLLDALRTAEHVAQLATNPLMCGLICALHRDRRGFLPRGRKALYEAALSMLLARRDRERDMRAPYGIELGEAPQIQLIQRLAYWLTLNGRTQMDRSRAESIVRSAVPAVPEAAGFDDPDAVFTHLLHRSGLLREPAPDTVDFVHRTFQDHLAAKALVDDWHIGVLVDHAADDQWEDVIRMAVGHARPRECAEIFGELLKAADATEDRRTQLRILVVAATALEEATEVSPEIRERILARTAEVIPPRDPGEARELASVGRAVLDLLPGPEGLDADEARGVVIAATHVRSDAALPFLAQFVDHPDVLVRSQLMWAWSRFETAPYAREIIARLDPDLLHFTVRSDEQAHEIAHMGVRPQHLDIRRGVSAWGLEALHPQLASAATVRLEPSDFSLLEAVPAENLLNSLSLSLSLHEGDRLTEEQWQAVASMERLDGLSTTARILSSCPETVRLPGVTLLDLRCERADPPLARIARLFPGLERVTLVGFPRSRPHDVSPLAPLQHLSVAILLGAETVGEEHLPAVEVIT
ncbi:NACHT domain-containing protein [Streptomyces sp. ISL-36]|uniref:NACHT domain-containing protein n=1 Tax=Streptomyces sp. ISL-36 TaxID=2819182 RepID=UPI001BED2C31|nr:NACHT domain-containing protein [Streptomyces sp. ISL-36]MBT2443868.1 NACHT domain-containing protein [Streptomyces sp. ISL-36]